MQAQVPLGEEVMVTLLSLWVRVGMAKVKTWEGDQVQQGTLLGHGSTYISQEQGPGKGMAVIIVAFEGSLG